MLTYEEAGKKFNEAVGIKASVDGAARKIFELSVQIKKNDEEIIRLKDLITLNDNLKIKREGIMKELSESKNDLSVRVAELADNGIDVNFDKAIGQTIKI